jgi:hypothetical protein
MSDDRVWATCAETAESMWDEAWKTATKEEKPKVEVCRWEVSKMAELLFVVGMVMGIRSDLEALAERVDKLADVLEGGSK